VEQPEAKLQKEEAVEATEEKAGEAAPKEVESGE
jgi:hypothetical protein